MNKKQIFLYLAWILSLIGTLGSLSTPLFYGHAPCSLCWYQRIFLFPLTWILGAILYQNQLTAIRLILALPLFGALVSGYQIVSGLIQDLDSCSGSCSLAEGYGILFWMPILSFCNFLIIFIFLFYARQPVNPE